MKPIKLITSLSLPILALSSVTFSLTACNEPDEPQPGPQPGPEPDPTPWTDETPQEYIYNRTFSILASFHYNSELAYCAGTGWIIDDSTPDNNSDYNYYLATNLHVTFGFDLIHALSLQLEVDDFAYSYADKSLESDSYIKFSDYIPFGDDCFDVNENVDNFTFKNQTPVPDPQPDKNYFEQSIDLSFCDVNFGSPTGSIKTKLDKINQIKKESGMINNFVNGSDSEYLHKKKYVAGYPSYLNATTEKGTHWEIETISADEQQLLPKNTAILKYDSTHPTYGHCIYDYPQYDQYGRLITYPVGTLTIDFPYYDVAPQFFSDLNVAESKKPEDWMTHGASGSMLLTEDLEVCGIYWGGYGIEDEETQANYFLPSFSLFKSNEQDFISKWLTKK